MITRSRPAVAFILAAVCCLAPSLPAQERLVDIYGLEADDGSFSLFATSHHIVPVYVRLELPTLINLSADRDLPVGFGLEPGQRDVPILTLSPIRGSGRRGYSVQYSFAQGNPETARHTPEQPYLLPFAHGTKHRLSQGFRGSFTHFGENEYAIDFEMDVGTPVHAARDGVVAEVKEDSRAGGPSARYGDDANYVLILHDDGSFGNYAHLRYGGAEVEPGEEVSAGEIIGYSGNTGRSSGPHLHFDVRLPTYDGRMQSVPFEIQGADGPLQPEQGRFYYAYHPGGAPFEEELGSDLTVAAYAGYREPFLGPETVDTRVEQIDLTFVVFVQNGFSQDMEVELVFQLSGLESDRGETVRVQAPGRSEVFATILRPVAGATSIRYSYTVRYFR